MNQLIIWARGQDKGYRHDCKECYVRNMGKWSKKTVLRRVACDNHKSEVLMQKLGMHYPALSSAWNGTIVGSDG